MDPLAKLSSQCPLEINLTESRSPDIPWSCDVRLQRKYEHTPEEAHHANSPYPHFRLLEMSEDEHFQTVTQKDQLQAVLERAQAATLKPHRHRSFRDLHTSAVSSLKFSPNIVRLDVRLPPNSPPLYFWLPLTHRILTSTRSPVPACRTCRSMIYRGSSTRRKM